MSGMWGFDEDTAKRLKRLAMGMPDDDVRYPKRAISPLRAYLGIPLENIPGAATISYPNGTRKLLLGTGFIRVLQRQKHYNIERASAIRPENPVSSRFLINRTFEGHHTFVRVFNMCPKMIHRWTDLECSSFDPETDSFGELNHPLLFCIQDSYGDLYIIKECCQPFETSSTSESASSFSISASSFSFSSFSGSYPAGLCLRVSDSSVEEVNGIYYKVNRRRFNKTGGSNINLTYPTVSPRRWAFYGDTTPLLGAGSESVPFGPPTQAEWPDDTFIEFIECPVSSSSGSSSVSVEAVGCCPQTYETPDTPPWPASVSLNIDTVPGETAHNNGAVECDAGGNVVPPQSCTLLWVAPGGGEAAKYQGSINFDNGPVLGGTAPAQTNFTLRCVPTNEAGFEWVLESTGGCCGGGVPFSNPTLISCNPLHLTFMHPVFGQSGQACCGGWLIGDITE